MADITAPAMPAMPAITVAQSFWRRFLGLMLTAGLPHHRGLLLVNCPSVHTCFMRYALDLVYVDAQGRIVKLVAHLRPWWGSTGGAQAVHVLELAAGSIARLGLQIGQPLSACVANPLALPPALRQPPSAPCR